MPSNNPINSAVIDAITNYSDNYHDIDLISLSTTDGFPVYNFTRHLNDFEGDKMAAAASTLYSVSNAVSQQILNKQFSVTFIETEGGNVAFVTLNMDDNDYVLSMSGTKAMSIAQLRLLLNRLAADIAPHSLFTAA